MVPEGQRWIFCLLMEAKFELQVRTVAEDLVPTYVVKAGKRLRHEAGVVISIYRLVDDVEVNLGAWASFR